MATRIIATPPTGENAPERGEQRTAPELRPDDRELQLAADATLEIEGLTDVLRRELVDREGLSELRDIAMVSILKSIRRLNGVVHSVVSGVDYVYEEAYRAVHDSAPEVSHG